MSVTEDGSVAGHDVEVRYDVRVPMPDGVRLAGNLYLPASGDEGAWPAIMTLIPYHKDGRGGRGSLDAYHRHFASRGYAALHLDIRGTGSSEGRLYGPFDGRERTDGYHAVEWIARQPWCTGDVGVWGISYGGITSMAIAETHPPHLRAIVPVHAPDDNYEAMIVHRGARLMFWPDPHWGAGMVASNLMPPLRYDDGGDWLRVWRQRLDAQPWMLDWYGEPPDTDYWVRQRLDAGKIEVPTFAICGWQDAYPDSVSQLYGQLRGPKRLLFGPWKHAMPESAVREPVDTLTEIDRWWDRWLKGVANGVEEEPPVTIFVQGIDEWRHECEWPPARATERRFYPRPDRRLGAEPAPDENGGDRYDYDARAGLGALAYDACTPSIPYPQDQSFDDYLSLHYTTDPLDEALEVTGEPSVRCLFSTEAPVEEITLVAKLCDVDPTGQSFLVAFDQIAGARARQMERDGDGALYEAEIVLRPTSYVFQTGHRIRLAISGSNFPYLWPTPRRYQLTLHRSARRPTTLALPVAPPQEPALPRPVLGAPPKMKPAGRLASGESYWTHREETSKTVSFEGKRTNLVEVEPGTTLSILQHFVMTVDAERPSSATTRTTAEWRLERSAGAVATRVRTITTLHDVQIEAEIDLDGFPYVRRNWQKSR